MKHIVFIAIMLLVSLATPVIAHQVPPVEVNGLAVESSVVLMIAIDTDCFDLSIEQSMLEKVLQDSTNHLPEPLMLWTFYSPNLKGSIGVSTVVRSHWQGNVGYTLAA